MDAKLCCQNHMIAIRLQCLPHQFFIIMGMLRSSINLRRIEKRVAYIYCLCQKFRHLFSVCRCSISMAHSHTAKTDCGNSQTCSKYSFFHSLSPFSSELVVFCSQNFTARSIQPSATVPSPSPKPWESPGNTSISAAVPFARIHSILCCMIR